VHYLVFNDKKVRLGLTLGERDGRLLSPFSAPFGGFVNVGDRPIDTYHEAVALLLDYATAQGCNVEIALPPAFYGGEEFAKTVSALSRYGQLMWADVNYHYDLTNEESFENRLKRNARNKWNIALKHPMVLEVLNADCDADVERAYKVIQANRQSHGYPLRMSLDAVLATRTVLEARFLVMSLDGVDIAAAQLQRVTDRVMQVVYWGDVPGYSDTRVMNRFTLEVFHFCKQCGVDFVDIGPSSEDGMPSFGLCDFKTSLGCEVSIKPRFRLACAK
jgi:hypothetical protein